MASSLNFNQPQDPWIIAINNIFHNNDIDVPICVFKVPDSLKASNPEAYSPQVVGLGLLHHNRLELESTQMYKVGVARKMHKGFGRIEFK